MNLRRNRTVLGAAAFLTAFATTVLFFETADLPRRFDDLYDNGETAQFTDRFGNPLNTSYDGYWNRTDAMKLHEVPETLQKMIVSAEDGRFYDHSGVDWLARFAALFQNVSTGKIVRGASSLTEQVVRMIRPRRRTVFSKLAEGIDAWRLERRFSKADILEFYLNQVPYASNRRGIKQAAAYYFSKTPDRLSVRESAALTVLIRAPSAFDLYKNPMKTKALIDRALDRFYAQGIVSKSDLEQAKRERLRVKPLPETPPVARFLEYVSEQAQGRTVVRTTLDPYVQKTAVRLTRSRLKELRHAGAMNAALLVLDAKTGEILAWVSESLNPDTKDIDAVRVPRQPASAQKPLLYALAIEKGLRAWTLIDDAPFAKPVGTGIHHFKNYSRTYYGKVTLRQALGNSLNIPALKTIGFTGVESYYGFLKSLGFSHLNQSADFYREGLALGNAEVTLPELARAYLMLANGGTLLPLKSFSDQEFDDEPKRIVRQTTASLIADILSDDAARRLEFGEDSILNFSVRTAVKTGTSTDYRDAWAIGFDDRYVVGAWMGDLTYKPMTEITGATGPALLLRSVFAKLNEGRKTTALKPVPTLKTAKIGGTVDYFDPEIPESFLTENEKTGILSPANGVRLAIDPRVPMIYQQYEFSLNRLPENADVVWAVDGRKVGEGKSFFWPLERGSHTVTATVTFPDGKVEVLPESVFYVR